MVSGVIAKCLGVDRAAKDESASTSGSDSEGSCISEGS